MTCLQLVIDLEKSKKKQKKDTLPPGGVWRTVRGAKVYIKDGKVIVGAEGKLSKFDIQEISAIHEAREKRKIYDQLIFEGTKVKVKNKRKTGTVVGETKLKYEIDYGDGKIKKEYKRDVYRADIRDLKTEEKLESKTKMKRIIDPVEKPESVKVAQQKERGRKGAVAKTDEEFVEDFSERITPARVTPAGGLVVEMLQRDEHGFPVTEPILDKTGKPVFDPHTGLPKKKYLTHEVEDVSEEEILKDSMGLVYTEVVNPFATNIGLEFIQRQWKDEFGNPTDLYGDLVQTASVGFLFGIREYAYDLAQGKTPSVDVKTQGLLRARQHVSRQAQTIFSTVKLPEKMLAPLSVVSAIEERMTKELERKPTITEMIKGVKGIEGLEKNPIFMSLKMREAPSYDEAKESLQSGKMITDPEKKLEAVYKAKILQRATSLDTTKITPDVYWGDKEVTLKDVLHADEGETADKRIEAALKLKEETKRRRTLKRQIEKLLGDVGLNKKEMEFIEKRFGIGIRGKDKYASLEEVADEMNISLSYAKKLSSSSVKKLKSAPPEKLKAIKEIYLKKSIYGLNLFLKTAYVDELQKALETFGLSLQDLESKYMRSEVGAVEDIKKSLDTIEFIGSVTSVEGSNNIYATIIEYVLPENLGELIEKSTVKKNINVKDYVLQNQKRYQGLANKQRSEFASKKLKTGTASWSVQLLLDNPGSCWVTWNNRRILINANSGDTVYDSAVRHHREKYHPESKTPDYDFLVDYPADEIYTAVADRMRELKEKFKTLSDKKELKGFVKGWREEHKEEFAKTKSNKITKVFPSGKFLLENPYSDKKIIMLVDIEGAGTDKATTKVIHAFDPDADATVNIGNWREIWRHLYGDIYKRDKDGKIIEKDGKPLPVPGAWEYLMNDANIPGRHTVEVLDDKKYDEYYGETTQGMVEGMVHKNFREVTPDMMKITEIDPQSKKFIGKEVPYDGDRVFKADIGGGRETEIRIKDDGTFSDPILQSLINPAFPVRDANDLGYSFREAIGNEVWTTISSPDVDRLNHHVKLRYDGKGAPIVVGGAFAGFRFQDASEVDDPEEKQKSLFRHGKVVRTGQYKTAKTELPLEVGAMVRIKNPQDKRKWIDAEIVRSGAFGRDWVVKIPDNLVERGITFDDGSDIRVLSPKDMKKKLERLPIAKEAPIIDKSYGDMLTIAVPDQYKGDFEANYGVELDKDGRARISVGQFMEIRDRVGSFSLTNKARDHLEDYYKKMIRAGMPNMDELREKFNPNEIIGFKDNSFLKKTNFYTSQLEGMEFLTGVKKGMAGHGMGTGKTILGVGASLYLRDKAIKEGREPKKTLVISPAGIINEWLKTVDRDTKVGAVILTSEKDPKRTAREVRFEDYKNTKHDEHFVVMSYDQFMKNPKKFAKMADQFENMIIDEVHNFKNAGGSRNKALKEISGNFENLWGLSGTVMDNEITDAYHLIDAVTGGKHSLGTYSDFSNTYLMKKTNKIVGMNESKLKDLGKKISNYVQFRDGYNDSIYYVDAQNGESKKVNFPEVVSNVNRYHGQVTPLVDYDTVHIDTGKKDPKGNPVTRAVKQPKLKGSVERAVYKRYGELEKQYLTEEQMQAIIETEEAGIDVGSKGYLGGVHVLQQFLNAPISEQAYFKTDSKTKQKEYPHKVDKEGNKRYYKALKDGTGYEKDPQGKPVLLPPTHHYNPKADGLRKMINDKFAAHERENERRIEANKKLAPGQKPFPVGKDFPPKIVISSGYTTFGTDVIENVIREFCKNSGHSYGVFVGGGSSEREIHKKRFLQDPNNAFMIISPAGKEGISFSNGKDLIHYDHGFNPHKSAQISARIIRSSNWKVAEKEMRANEVNLTTLNMPGTIEDVILRTHDRKMDLMTRVEREARKEEGQVIASDYAKPTPGETKRWVKRAQKSLRLIVELKEKVPLVITNFSERGM